MCASSLNKPSSQELLERLKGGGIFGSQTWAEVEALCREAATLISELQAETERLRRELGTSNDNHRSMAKTLAEAGKRALAAEFARHLEKTRADNLEQNCHEATTRHPSFNDAMSAEQREIAAKMLAAKMLTTEWADLKPFTRAKYRTAILTMESIIAAAVRAHSDGRVQA